MATVGATTNIGRRAVRTRRDSILRSAVGLSVIDMIMSLSITAIAAGAAVPTVSRWAGMEQLRRSAIGLSGDLVRARSMAISRNRMVRVRVTGTGAYALESSSDGTNWASLGALSLPKGITAASGSEVRFDRRGFPTVRDTLTLSNTASQSRSVSTSAMGRVVVN